MEHRVAAYAARAAVESWSWRTALGGRNPCRSTSLPAAPSAKPPPCPCRRLLRGPADTAAPRVGIARPRRRRGHTAASGRRTPCAGHPLARAAASKASPPPPGGPDEAIAALIHRLGSAIHGAFGVAPAAKCGTPRLTCGNARLPQVSRQRHNRLILCRISGLRGLGVRPRPAGGQRDRHIRAVSPRGTTAE